jgi:hypothetical protein
MFNWFLRRSLPLFGSKRSENSPRPAEAGCAPADPPPEGRVFWEIRGKTGNDVKVAHGIGNYLVLGPEWDELGKRRRAAATAAAPRYAHIWGSSTFPATEYRYLPEHFPRAMVLNRKAPKKKALPEYSSIGSAEAAYVVSARVAAIIERFEPDRFNFIPFTCAPEAGEPVQHFCFWQPRELNEADAVIFERSGYEQVPGPDGGTYWREQDSSVKQGLERPPLILDAAKVAGRHWLTTGKWNGLSHRVISDELKQALGEFLPDHLTLVEARAV